MSIAARTPLNNYENVQPKAANELPSANRHVGDPIFGYDSEWQHYVWESAMRDKVAVQLLEMSTQ